MDKAMWEDLASGFVYGLASLAVVPWWAALLVACVCAAFWMLGGIGWKGTNAWRRFFMPSLLCGVFMGHTLPHMWPRMLGPLVSLPLQIAALCQGYSVPDVNQTKASWLGTHFGKWARVVWFALLGLAMVPMFF